MQHLFPAGSWLRSARSWKSVERCCSTPRSSFGTWVPRPRASGQCPNAAAPGRRIRIMCGSVHRGRHPGSMRHSCRSMRYVSWRRWRRACRPAPSRRRSEQADVCDATQACSEGPQAGPRPRSRPQAARASPRVPCPTGRKVEAGTRHMLVSTVVRVRSQGEGGSRSHGPCCHHSRRYSRRSCEFSGLNGRRRLRALNGMPGLGCPTIGCGGTSPDWSIRRALMIPAMPAAASRWPMLAFTEPMGSEPCRADRP